MKRIITLLLVLAMLMPLNALAQAYTVDPASTTIQFRVKNLGFMSVDGAFEKFTGTVEVDETDLTKSKVAVSIETASINTGINKRDDHLRSADFFDVAKFPTMTFVSTRIEADADHLKVIGDLTIKGVTKQVILLVDGPNTLQGVLKRGATATVNRQDFGVSWGATVGDEVFVTIAAELVKP
jgi:polyisoprenoid-binding protein YceI